jgi:predicted house-cleaning noncanonical NTP pyrophosphatase (MazG superfamily)
MRQNYNKLVRDKIPDIILSSENQCEIAILSNSEYIQALKEKLLEEVREVYESNSREEFLLEIADLYEVIDTFLVAQNIEREEVLKKQKQRREERGGFQKRICLLWTEKD